LLGFCFVLFFQNENFVIATIKRSLSVVGVASIKHVAVPSMMNIGMAGLIMWLKK